jgi:hypothetical protein
MTMTIFLIFDKVKTTSMTRWYVRDEPPFDIVSLPEEVT